MANIKAHAELFTCEECSIIFSSMMPVKLPAGWHMAWDKIDRKSVLRLCQRAIIDMLIVVGPVVTLLQREMKGHAWEAFVSRPGSPAQCGEWSPVSPMPCRHKCALAS